jgi:hypothetical protein
VRRWVVLATIALVLLGLEWVTRTKLFHASKDLSRFAAYPARAKALCATPGKHVAFVGNSLTGEGVDPELFGREMGVNAGLFVADGSHINTWYWIIRHEFYAQGALPDVIVFHFYETSLEDGKRLEIGRLAQFFTDPGDWPEVFAHDVTGLEPRAELMLSSVWATYAVRDRIKERVLELVPGFEDFATEMNTIDYAHEARGFAGKPRQAATRNDLGRVIADAKEHHVRLLFVAFPTQPPAGQTVPYEIPDATRQVIDGGGELLLDLRQVPVLEKSHYRDEVHLTREGRAIYTRYLAQEIRTSFPDLLR